MKSLLYRDFSEVSDGNIKKFFLKNIALFFVISLFLMKFTEMNIIATAAFAGSYSVIQSLFRKDENSGSNGVFKSMPVSERKIVLSRYLTVSLIYFSILAAAFAAVLIGYVFKWKSFSPEDVSNYLLLPAVFFLYIFIQIPAIYRFGNSNILVIILFPIIFVAIFIIMVKTFDFFFIDFFVESLQYVAVILFFAISFISYFLSVKIYRNGDF